MQKTDSFLFRQCHNNGLSFHYQTSEWKFNSSLGLTPVSCICTFSIRLHKCISFGGSRFYCAGDPDRIVCTVAGHTQPPSFFSHQKSANATPRVIEPMNISEFPAVKFSFRRINSHSDQPVFIYRVVGLCWTTT